MISVPGCWRGKGTVLGGLPQPCSELGTSHCLQHLLLVPALGISLGWWETLEGGSLGSPGAWCPPGYSSSGTEGRGAAEPVNVSMYIPNPSTPQQYPDFHLPLPRSHRAARSPPCCGHLRTECVSHFTALCKGKCLWHCTLPGLAGQLLTAPQQQGEVEFKLPFHLCWEGNWELWTSTISWNTLSLIDREGVLNMWGKVLGLIGLVQISSSGWHCWFNRLLFSGIKVTLAGQVICSAPWMNCRLGGFDSVFQQGEEFHLRNCNVQNGKLSFYSIRKLFCDAKFPQICFPSSK